MKYLADLPDDLIEMVLHRVGTREKHRLLASGDARFAWRLHRRINKFQFRMRESTLLLPSWSHLRELKLTYEIVESNPFKIPSQAPLDQSASAITPPPSSTISTVLPNLILLKLNWTSRFWLSDLGAQNCAIMFPRLRFLYFERISQNGLYVSENFTYLAAWPLLETLHVDLHNGGGINGKIMHHLPPNLKYLKLPGLLTGDKDISYILPKALTHLDVGELEDGYLLQKLPLLHTLCIDIITSDLIFTTPLPFNITSLTVRRHSIPHSRSTGLSLDRAAALLQPSVKKLSIPFLWPLVFLSIGVEIDFLSVDVFSKLTRLDFEGTPAFQTFLAVNLHRFVNLAKLRMTKSKNFQHILNERQLQTPQSATIAATTISLPPSLRHLTVEIYLGMFLENLFMSADDCENSVLFRCKTLQSLNIILHFPPKEDALCTPQQSLAELNRIVDNISSVNRLENFSLTTHYYRHVYEVDPIMNADLFDKLMSRLPNVRDLQFHNIPFVTNGDGDATCILKSFISRLPRNLKHLDLSNSFNEINVTDQFLEECFRAMPHHLKTLRLFPLSCSSTLLRSNTLLYIAPILLDSPTTQILPFLRYFSVDGHATSVYGSVYTIDRGDKYYGRLVKTRIENFEAQWRRTPNECYT